MRNALNTFANNFSSDMYADGTLPNQITGLQAMVADAGTGTIGGIDSSSWPSGRTWSSRRRLLSRVVVPSPRGRRRWSR
jgi:hypothetical protein